MIKQVIDGGLKPEEMQRSTIIFTVFYGMLLIIYDMIMREDEKAYMQREYEIVNGIGLEEHLKALREVCNGKSDEEIDEIKKSLAEVCGDPEPAMTVRNIIDSIRR